MAVGIIVVAAILLIVSIVVVISVCSYAKYQYLSNPKNVKDVAKLACKLDATVSSVLEKIDDQKKRDYLKRLRTEINKFDNPEFDGDEEEESVTSMLDILPKTTKVLPK